MGDIWPCRGPWPTSYDACYHQMLLYTSDKHFSDVMAAIAGAESRYDLAVINDTPGTGDYSVGAWQINYYGSLYSGRVQLFGTPCHLISTGVAGQAEAALEIYNQQGFGAWSTYTNGAYRSFLHGQQGTGQEVPPGQSIIFIPPPPPPTTDDYSKTILRTSDKFGNLAGQANNAWRSVRIIRSRRIL